MRILAVLLLTGCAHMGTTADGVSTGAALSQGATEAGPIASLHPLAIPAVLAGRYAIVEKVKGTKDCTPVTKTVSAVGWGAAASNVAAAMTLGPQVGIPVGLIAAVIAHNKTPPCRCSVEDVPDNVHRATCEDGVITWETTSSETVAGN